jgi:hypothetical protein
LGLNHDDILRAREFEDIFQIVLRGALRCPDWVGCYTVNVYSQDQAEAVQRSCLEHNLAGSVTLEHVSLGLEDISLSNPTWNSDAAPAAETWAARQARRRTQSAEAMQRLRAARKHAAIADGTYRPRGRPRTIS